MVTHVEAVPGGDDLLAEVLAGDLLGGDQGADARQQRTRVQAVIKAALTN
ncbi:hypothetical protein [Streptomyces exfoliatus]